MGLLLLLQKPSPGAAQGIVPVGMTVIMEKVQGGEAFFCKESLHFGHGGPPVVVVALHQKLLAGELLEKAKVRLCLRHVDAPGGVPRQHQHIFCGQLAQRRLDPRHIILPGRAKDLHGFVGRQGQMQIPDGIEGHRTTPLSFG